VVADPSVKGGGETGLLKLTETHLTIVVLSLPFLRWSEGEQHVTARYLGTVGKANLALVAIPVLAVRTPRRAHGDRDRGHLGPLPQGAQVDRSCLRRVRGVCACAAAGVRSFGDTIPNCLGELGEIRERTGIAADDHPAGAPGATGVERLRPRENVQRLGGGEWGEMDCLGVTQLVVSRPPQVSRCVGWVI
jgi:hypothetical protein